jgi:16S rRNA (cytosine967-C5)-methyltransferase
VIRRVTEQDGYSNLTMQTALARSGLSTRDRALASELAYGTIRRLVSIDHVLVSKVDRPLDTTPAEALALLRLGTYQLRHTRIPPHAAVSETVALATDRQRGFVNAVLRRVASEASAPPRGDRDEDVAVRTGLSPWGVAELRRLLPADEVEPAAAALAERALVTLRTNTCRTTVDELERALATAGVATSRGAIHPASLAIEAGAPSELPGFHEGWFAVQDQASSFVVRVLDPQAGERVLDVCAGPGGKAGHIACLVGSQGRVVAADPSPVRAGLVRETIRRLGLDAMVLVQDGRRPAVRGPFDRVLVDAPCSGLGSARRRPELLWRARRSDVAGLARLQVGIGTATAELVRPGGRLVYSVCTFPHAETDAVCDALLRRVPELEPEAFEGPEGRVERLRLWPHRHGCDAMFVASFRRKG